MVCMKCGREAPEGQAFCQECLMEMEKYPVKPGTLVQLPNRRETAPPKKAVKRRGSGPEEQLRTMKKRIRILTILVALLLVLSAFLSYPAVRFLMNSQRFRPGQNYSSIVGTTASEEADPE